MLIEGLQQGQPLDKASKALILLHGRGATSESILGLADRFDTSSFFITAPQAPHNAWYPHPFMSDEQENEPALSQSILKIKYLIDEIAQVIPQKQIYLMGFSQGACLALEVAARFASPYGGIIAFTGGLIGKTLHPDKYQGNFQGTPVFIGTSDIDPHIPLARCQETKEIMEKLGANFTLKVYQGMGHTINEDEINWVQSNLFNEG